MTETLAKNSLAILIRRPPYGQIHAAEAIRHMGGALGDGMQTNVLLVDDGVYVARDGQDARGTAWTNLVEPLAKGIGKGACVYVHRPSAQARGLLDAEHFVIGVELVDDAGLARVLAQSETVMVY
ncbi:MAG: DsrE family protein [Chloroflexi bacterium]|nr:DsrE family protein [Chloroflexota bacterium]